MHYDRPQFREQDYAVRPSMRIFGALLLGFLASLMAGDVPQTFQLKAIPLKPCTTGKGQFLCEFGNWLNAMVPTSLQGPLAAVGQIGMAVIFSFGVWWLLKPLFTSKKRK